LEPCWADSSPQNATKSMAMGRALRVDLLSMSAVIMAAMGPLVSEAPRPWILPSEMLPLKGGMVMPSTPTVSRCGASMIRGLASEPGRRAMRLGRSGRTSSRVTWKPCEVR